MPKLHNPRVVKIFFSSPFGGMEEEREELTRRYFPSIRHLCNSYGLQFTAVDMRWGITTESSDKAQVINICLQELDRSDMFVGFFGQRYGWHGTEDSSLQKNFNNAIAQYSWLDGFRDRSVTELEFLHGFLNNPGHLPATILFRDKTYDDEQLYKGINSGDKKQIFKYSAESELSSTLLNDLKRRCWEQKEKSLGVYMDYKTPNEAAKIMFDTIMFYLKQVLLVDLDTKGISKREELYSQHQAFLTSRCNLYVNGEAYLRQLHNQLASESRKHVLVTGEAGCGKSALLCNWVNSLKDSGSTYAVVYHFMGFADNSTDPNSILLRLIGEFEYILSEKSDNSVSESSLNSTSTKANDNDFEVTQTLVQKLLTSMSQIVSMGKTPIIVLDGLEKQTNISKIKKVLFWLPNKFPSSSMVVVSTLTSDTQTVSELKLRDYLTVHIDSLPLDSKREMCVKLLEESSKELAPNQLERIVHAEMTKNPLFLQITLSELVAFGYFRLLDQKIDALVNSESIVRLFEKVLVRLEDDYNVPEHDGNLVEQVMSSIQLSHHGLSETEIKDIFSVPDHVWSPLHFAIENLVINKSGKIQFGFTELSDAVKTKYLSDPIKKNFYIMKLVNYLNCSLHQLDKSDILDGGSLVICHPALELPHLLMKLGDKNKLADCLSNYFVFSYLEYHAVYNLIFLWKVTGLSGNEIVSKLIAAFDKRLSEIYTSLEEKFLLDSNEAPGFKLLIFLQRIDRFLCECGFHESRERVIQRSVNILTESLKHCVINNKQEQEQQLHKQLYNLACVYSADPAHAEKGIQLHLQQIDILQSRLQSNGHSKQTTIELGHSYHGLGVAYMTLANYDKVIECTEQSIAYHMASGKPILSDLAASYNNIGTCYMFNKDFDKAIDYLQKSLKTYEEYHFGELPPVIGEILSNIGLCLRRMGKLVEAEEMYKRSLEVKLNAVGREHDIVAMAYINLGTLEMHKGNYQMAIQYTREALEIYETLGLRKGNRNYINGWENMMLFYIILQQWTDAEQHCMQTLELRLEDHSLDLGISSVYIDMAKYYLREKIYEKAYTVAYALVGSIHRDEQNCVPYILLDIACSNLTDEYRAKLPTEYTLAFAIENHPTNVYLIKHHVEKYLVPANDTNEIVRLLNRLHDLDTTGMKENIYMLTCDWCVNENKEINDICQQQILHEGLLKYPDNLELLLNMAKCYRRLQRPDLAITYAEKVAETMKDTGNFPLLLFTAQTALLAGECDTCSKWTKHISETCQDESVLMQVKEIEKYNEMTKRELSQTKTSSDQNIQNTE